MQLVRLDKGFAPRPVLHGVRRLEYKVEAVDSLPPFPGRSCARARVEKGHNFVLLSGGAERKAVARDQVIVEEVIRPLFRYGRVAHPQREGSLKSRVFHADC